MDARWTETETDQDGKYAINPFAINSITGRNLHIINVFPPDGAPYLVHQENMKVSRAARREVNVKLQRGVLLSGKVVDATSGKPISGARIQCSAAFTDAVSPEATEPSRLHVAISQSDGGYQLPVPNKRSVLYVTAPTLDYVREETSRRELDSEVTGGRRIAANAIVKLHFDKGDTKRNVDIQLRRGKTLRCRVIDAQGGPAKSVTATSPSYNPNGYCFSEPTLLRGNEAGWVEIPGCDPDTEHEVSFYDDRTRQGATVVLTGPDFSKSRTVQLQPCGIATAKLIDEAGNPVAGFKPNLGYVINKGVVRTRNRSESPLTLDYGAISWLQPEAYREPPTSDANGRIEFPELIPGLKYQFHWFPNAVQRPEDFPLNAPMHIFAVDAGEQKQLGEIVLVGHRSQKRGARSGAR